MYCSGNKLERHLKSISKESQYQKLYEKINSTVKEDNIFQGRIFCIKFEKGVEEREIISAAFAMTAFLKYIAS